MSKTTTKTAKTIKPGDVFITAYGHPDNIGKYVFVSCEPYNKKWTKIDVHRLTNNTIFTMFSSDSIDKLEFEVIDNENTDDCG